jgi:hypothetical protein
MNPLTCLVFPLLNLHFVFVFIFIYRYAVAWWFVRPVDINTENLLRGHVTEDDEDGNPVERGYEVVPWWLPNGTNDKQPDKSISNDDVMPSEEELRA